MTFLEHEHHRSHRAQRKHEKQVRRRERSVYRATVKMKSGGQARRCGARTRGGTPCQRPALRGRKRCRLHGGLSPGAPRGEKNGNYKTGEWTLEAIEERKWLRSLVRSFCKGTK